LANIHIDEYEAYTTTTQEKILGCQFEGR